MRVVTAPRDLPAWPVHFRPWRWLEVAAWVGMMAVVVAAAVRCGDGGMTGVLGDDVVGMAFCMRRFTYCCVAFDCRWVLRFDALVRKSLASHASLAPADLVRLRTRDEVLWSELRDQELRTAGSVAGKEKGTDANRTAAPAAPVVNPQPAWVPPKESSAPPQLLADDKRGAAAANLGARGGKGRFRQEGRQGPLLT